MKHDELDGLLGALHSAYGRLDSHGQRKLVAIIRDLALLVEIQDKRESDIRSEKLASIARYVNRKIGELNPLRYAEDVISLRMLRNRVVHGDIENLGTPAEVRRYHTMVWRTLLRSANEWDPLELSNFLAYCIGTHEIEVDPISAGPARIVSLYRAAFNALDGRRKHHAFRELLLRLYSDPRFRRMLESQRDS